MNDLPAMGNQTITTPNDDNLKTSDPKPLMVTETLTSEPPTQTPNENPTPKFEPIPSSSLQENTLPTQTAPLDNNTNSSYTPSTNQPLNQPVAAVPNEPITTTPSAEPSLEDTQTYDPGFTVTSNNPDASPVTVENVQNTSPKSNAPFYLGLVALFLAISIPLTVYLNQKVKTQTQAKTELEQTTQTVASPVTNIIFYKPEKVTLQPTSESDKYLKEIVKNFAWIDTQKTAENTYYLGQIINNSVLSENKIVDNRVGLYAAWSKYNYWIKTQDTQVLSSLTADLNTLNTIETYQPDFWSCKLLYQLGNDNRLTPNVKDLALSACKRAVFGTISFDVLANPTGSNPIDVPEKDLTQVFNATSQPLPQTQFANSSYLNFFINNSAVVSNYLAKAWLLDDGQFVLDAKKSFNYAIDNYQNLNQMGNTPEACILGEASLDMYTATKDNKYLDFAKQLLNKEVKNISTTAQPFAKISCLYFIKDLNKVAPQTEYLKYQTDLLQDILKNNYDANNGFIFSSINKITYRETKNTSLLTAFLSSL